MTTTKETHDLTAQALGELTIRDIQEGLQSGRYSAEALTKAAIAQMKAVNGTYNAVIFENEAALETAKDIDRRLAAGEELGSLAGVPIVVKIRWT